MKLGTVTAAKIRRRRACAPCREAGVELMLRVQAEEPGAFAELIQQYWPRVFGKFCRQFRSHQEAEDLAQDVFLRVYRHRHRYVPRARFSTWLFHISRNVASNALRTRRRRPCVPFGSFADTDHHDVLSQCNRTNAVEAPSQQVEREEVAVLVRTAMAGLAFRQRVALELQFQDRSYSEIAAELDMTPKAAKSLLYRARLQLRAGLHDFMAADA
jgi:RNA polymerase sigma-70 factor (ECF subfamily)